MRVSQVLIAPVCGALSVFTQAGKSTHANARHVYRRLTQGNVEAESRESQVQNQASIVCLTH